ncbi:response regulator transcription factor [Candidatus Dojkabacteria bacterium]|jgi:DNA-binding response OmpR family regulator|nr:response regulator transcription factor [Candidatus Dojkabacteria bacterium]
MKRQKVLIVEDNATLVHMLQRFFDGLGFDSDYAYTGKQFTQRLRENHYVLIIVDIVLPDTSGFEVIKKIRKFNKETPIIVITTDEEIESQIKSFKEGASLFHKKPIEYTLLREQVFNLLRKDSVDVEKEIGELVINLNSRTVKKGNKDISLTCLEFAMLEVLINNAKSILSREAIISLLDEDGCEKELTSVDTIVCRIRKKLGEEIQDSIIETVRGVGYRIRSGI